MLFPNGVSTVYQRQRDRRTNLRDPGQGTGRGRLADANLTGWRNMAHSTLHGPFIVSRRWASPAVGLFNLVGGVLGVPSWDDNAPTLLQWLNANDFFAGCLAGVGGLLPCQWLWGYPMSRAAKVGLTASGRWLSAVVIGVRVDWEIKVQTDGCTPEVHP